MRRGRRLAAAFPAGRTAYSHPLYRRAARWREWYRARERRRPSVADRLLGGRQFASYRCLLRHLFQGEADAPALLVDLDDHDVYDIADGYDVERMFDALLAEF